MLDDKRIGKHCCWRPPEGTVLPNAFERCDAGWHVHSAVRLLQVGHQDFVWELRKDARIVEVFEALWGTDALLTSFDG